MKLAPDSGELDRLFRFLVAYRLPIYLGGVVAISGPVFLALGFDFIVAETVRTTIVVVSLGLMFLTYVAERRVGFDHVDDRTGAPTERYPRRMRAAVAASILGVAVGIYVALDVSLLYGALFIVGAYLFGLLAYRGERKRAGAESETGSTE